MDDLDPRVLHDLEIATELAIAEVCHEHGFNYSPHINEVVRAVVGFVITGIYTPGQRFDPMNDDEYTDERVKRIVGTVANFMLDRCDDLNELIRITRLWDIAGRNKAA